MEIKEIVCDFKNLYNAMHTCKKNTQWKDSVAGYLNNCLINIYKLKEQLESGKYKMDDFILIHQDKEYLKMCKEKIRQMVEAKGLTLNKKKSHIHPIGQPIHFLGFSYLLTKTGKVVVKVLPKRISHERRKLKKQVDRVNAGLMTKEQVDDCFKSYKAHVSGRRCGKTRRKRKVVLKRNTHNLILKMDIFYKNLWRTNMKYVSKDELSKKNSREVKELRATVKAEQAKTDYIAMMVGVDVEKGETQNDDK